MRISSHGRASKCGRKTLCNVCVCRGNITCISHCKQGPCRLRRTCARKHRTTHDDDGETRVHAICIHDVSTCDYVSLSHDAFSAPRFFNSRDISYTKGFLSEMAWNQAEKRIFVSLCNTNFFSLRNNSRFPCIWLGLSNCSRKWRR